MTTPKIKIPSGLPFRFVTGMGPMELRKGQIAEERDTIPGFLEIGALDPISSALSSWRLGDDDGLRPPYESIVSAGYELVDLSNPSCDALLRMILKTLVQSPGVEVLVEESVLR